jgi:hypothetical protein
MKDLAVMPGNSATLNKLFVANQLTMQNGRR